MARRTKPTIDDELIDKLLEGREHSAALLGNDGLIGELNWSVALSLVIPGGDILCRRDSGNGDKFFCAPDALRPPPHPTSSLGRRARRLPQMARRRIGCACIGPSLAPGPAAPAPLRPHARAYACRGLPASCFALPWRAAEATGRTHARRRGGRASRRRGAAGRRQSPQRLFAEVGHDGR